MQRDAQPAVVIDFAAYRAARAATHATTGQDDNGKPHGERALNPDRVARLRNLTPREISHRTRMLSHLDRVRR